MAPALPSDLGHMLTDDRHGLVVNVQCTGQPGEWAEIERFAVIAANGRSENTSGPTVTQRSASPGSARIPRTADLPAAVVVGFKKSAETAGDGSSGWMRMVSNAGKWMVYPPDTVGNNAPGRLNSFFSGYGRMPGERRVRDRLGNVSCAGVILRAHASRPVNQERQYPRTGTPENENRNGSVAPSVQGLRDQRHGSMQRGDQHEPGLSAGLEPHLACAASGI